MARVRVNLEHRRRCAALAAARFRLRAMPVLEILASVGFTAAHYYQDPIVAGSTGIVARDAFRAKWKRKEPPTRFELEERERLEELDEEVRHVNREPTDAEIEALDEPRGPRVEQSADQGVGHIARRHMIESSRPRCFDCEGSETGACARHRPTW